ncbi:MAG: hypothetical protein NXI22_01130 [bacterium]|nr:hypothetical protein [bacterium]
MFWRIAFLILLCLFVFGVDAAVACPTCKQAVAENGNQEGMIQGYFFSIIFMMSMPFLIFGGLSLYFYILVRSARAATAKALANQDTLPAPSV